MIGLHPMGVSVVRYRNGKRRTSTPANGTIHVSIAVCAPMTETLANTESQFVQSICIPTRSSFWLELGSADFSPDWVTAPLADCAPL